MIIPDETLLAVIHRYTRESGVRELERTIGGLARKVALRIARGDTRNVTVQPSDLKEFLGPERFQLESIEKRFLPGSQPGLPGPKPAATSYTSRPSYCRKATVASD